MDEEMKATYVAAARRLHGHDDVAIDNDAEVSCDGDITALHKGCFVAAWVWVPKEAVAV
jgi:hypothetical protein